jgi:hypothetical protein
MFAPSKPFQPMVENIELCGLLLFSKYKIQKQKVFTSSSPLEEDDSLA